LAAALAAACPGLPPFFVPVIEAGETTGRLDDSLRFLETHCRLLARPAAAVRNFWLIPLVVILAGTMFKLLAYLSWGSWSGTWAFVWGSGKSCAAFAALLFVMFSAPFRPMIDFLKLHVPFVGPLERDLNANRFFHALAALHATAGHRVEQMVRIASRTVNNQLLQADLEVVATVIERGGTITDGFDQAHYLSPMQKQMIATGDLSGTLERSYEHIANEAGSTLQVRLDFIQRWSVRITLYLVVMSIVHTLYGLIVAART
jgi:type II secretory pathway component PulF